MVVFEENFQGVEPVPVREEVGSKFCEYRGQEEPLTRDRNKDAGAQETPSNHPSILELRSLEERALRSLAVL